MVSDVLQKKYDVIVIGAGHAGLEAAFISAKFNLKVGLFTLNKSGVANLPCNPSIGGPAKGVVTREIDALGGIQGIAADANKIQIKNVNYSKGPGVWAYRAQIDKEAYHTWFLDAIDKHTNIDLVVGEVISLVIQDNKVSGVVFTHKDCQYTYEAKTVIITTGTYMKAELYHDAKFAESGPDNYPRSNYLSDFLKEYGVDVIRLKTGTSPRIYSDSIDFTKMTKDEDNNDKISFSYQAPKTLPLEEQHYCYLTNTTDKTKEFVNKHKDKFGIYNGNVCAQGPRYCPSIEDKFFRFPHRERHHIFVEPVGKNLDFHYLSGISTSLEKDLQVELIRTLPGFENARIKRYAYAISYDAINPIQLHKTLELKKVKNIYFAGQVNGTSGYEEAAAQGLMAGINSALNILKKDPFILSREESYIGVLIDDITSKGVAEPYRLLTSRAEFRLLLRNDNADERLMKYGFELGLISKDLFDKQETENSYIEFNIDFLKNNYATKFQLENSSAGNLTLFSWLCRENSRYEMIAKHPLSQLKKLDPNSLEKLLIKVKYEGYIKQQKQKIDKLEKWKKIPLLKISDYSKIHNLSSEAVEKLNLIRPININDALKISGLNINDIIWIKNHIDNNSSTNQ